VALTFFAFLGFGIIMTVTALFATAGATNAGLYPAQGLSERLAQTGPFPPLMARKLGGRASNGLLIQAAICLIMAVVFKLGSIASIGSAVALVIFTMITAALMRIRSETGANLPMLILAIVAAGAVLVTFVFTTLIHEPASIGTLAGILVLSIGLDYGLRRVMVHRPGLEHSRLTPSNAEELLFDDVLWVARAKAEHDMFAEAMRDRGVEVFEAEDLLAQALATPGARAWVCDHILSEHEVGVTAARRAAEWVAEADPALVAEFLIGGITKADVQRDVGLVWESADPTSMLLPPLPNFLFQRDPSCWISNGVTINPMTKPARKPETMIMETIYRFCPMFAAEEFPVWLGGAEED
jgi:Arginine deiminase